MKKIILIGFACCGKSTVGKILANRLNCAFVDTDREIAKRSNLTVEQIFGCYGENYFREKENQLLKTLVDGNTVVACGGGSVLADSFNAFSADGTVVWLTATAQTVRDRLGDVPRPLFDRLTVEQLNEYMLRRNPIYEKYAHIKFATDCKTPEQVAEEIRDWFVKRH
ncbi:MAG: shikimate kinase [Clostridiales bacterium]|nr:shikimate kinase [Clostridiales bacterium]